MLLPRYSLRSTLFGITYCAIFFLVLGQAVQGRPWAIVISATVASLLVLLAFQALLFLAAAGLSRFVGAPQLPARTSQGGVQANSGEQSPPLSDASRVHT